MGKLNLVMINTKIVAWIALQNVISPETAQAHPNIQGQLEQPGPQWATAALLLSVSLMVLW